jgi:hypothetical protein
MTDMLSRGPGRCLALLVGITGLVSLGCQNTPVDLTEGPAPWRIPRPDGDPECYEDSLTGGQVFTMYCNQCHNARALAERPFANYQNVAAHMRVRAQLTGTEHAKLMEFLRRFHDIPAPNPAVEPPSPKRLIFSQPLAELRDEQAKQAAPAGSEQPQPAPAQPAAPAQGQPFPAAIPTLPEPIPAPAPPAAPPRPGA